MTERRDPDEPAAHGRLELNGTGRMYADELHEAVARAEAGEATWITRGGIRVAKITPVVHWDAAAVREQHKARNDKLVEGASRHGQPWTKDERELAAREDLTIAEAARQLGRSYEAVREARRQAAGLPPKPGRGKPRPPRQEPRHVDEL